MPPKLRHATAASDRIPFPQLVAYGLGGAAASLAINAVTQLSGLVYVVGLGLSAVWIGYTQAIPRIWDALVDPLVGGLSDNCRSRFGRRMPFLVAGGALLGAAFWLLWLVPRGWSKPAMLSYIIAASLLFYSAFSVYNVPYGALGLELTGDYHEKTRLFAFAGFLNNATAFVLPWVYYLANRPAFRGDEVRGVRWVCLGLGAVLVLFALACPLVCRETKLAQARGQPKVPILASIRIAWANPAFARLVAAYVLMLVGFQLVMGLANFTTIFYLYGGAKDAASALMGWNGTLWSVVGLAGVFPLTWASRRYGKRATALAAFAILIAGNLSKVLFYRPAHPWMSLFPTALLSLGMVFAFSLVYAMIADVCDEDELSTGVRREGIYSAVYAWFWKLAVAIAAVANGYLIRWTGFLEGAPRQSPSTLFWIRFWEIGLPPVLCVAGLLLLRKFPLTEERAYEIKALLKARRDAAPVQQK